MSDNRLLDLKRAWEASGSTEDEVAYLGERVRVGDLTQNRFELLCRLREAISEPPMSKSFRRDLKYVSPFDGFVLGFEIVVALVPSYRARLANDILDHRKNPTSSLAQVDPAHVAYAAANPDLRIQYDQTPDYLRAIANPVEGWEGLGWRVLGIKSGCDAVGSLWDHMIGHYPEADARSAWVEALTAVIQEIHCSIVDQTA